MSAHAAPRRLSRRVSAEYCPEMPPDSLALVVGTLDHGWQVLCSGDKGWEDAVNAWQHQGHWERREHEAYWRLKLAMWPRKRGQPSIGRLYAPAIVQWMSAGYSLAQVTSALGYSADSLPATATKAASEYAEWLDKQAFGVRGLRGYALLERMAAGGKTEEAERHRSAMRNTIRTPRVVDGEHGSRFGHPEQISSEHVDPHVQENVERAARTLAAAPPAYRARRRGEPLLGHRH